MDKDFFTKLASVGPDGKFSSYGDSVSVSARPVKISAKPRQFNSLRKKDFISSFNEEKEVKIAEQKIEIEPVGPQGRLMVDIYRTSLGFIIESTVAGVDPESVDVSINPDTVSIKGSRRKAETVEEKDYLHKECFWGRFTRSIILPEEIDPDKSHASLKNGVLRIVAIKANRQKLKKLEINEA